MLGKYFHSYMYNFREKWKNISQFDMLFLPSTRSCLQFQWNRKYISSAVLRLRDRLLMAPWHGLHLFLIKGKNNGFFHEGFSLIRFVLYISAAIRLLFKIFCQENNFKSISSFPTFACPETFQNFCYCNAIQTLLPSSFPLGKLRREFYQFYHLFLNGL